MNGVVLKRACNEVLRKQWFSDSRFRKPINSVDSVPIIKVRKSVYLHKQGKESQFIQGS